MTLTVGGEKGSSTSIRVEYSSVGSSVHSFFGLFLNLLVWPGKFQNLSTRVKKSQINLTHHMSETILQSAQKKGVPY